MVGKVSSHVRNNVVGYVAVFIALSGSAYAAVALEKNQVKSKHIGQGQVKNPDLADNSVTSPKVADGSLLNQDFAPGQLPAGPQGERGLQGEEGLRGPPGQDGANGTDIATIGRHSFGGTCSDDDENGQDCATVTINMPQAGRLFVSASTQAEAEAIDDAGSATDAVAHVVGQCVLTVDGAGQTGSTTFTMYHDQERDSGAMTAVTPSPLPAGTHTVVFRCTEMDGDIEWQSNNVSAVMLGNG